MTAGSSPRKELIWNTAAFWQGYVILVGLGMTLNKNQARLKIVNTR